MSGSLTEWLQLATRWFHVVAGVFWLGQTALFTWLDTRMRVEAGPDGEEVWMVHSGGFYRVEKIAAPERMPRILHWFKWEAALTWISGMAMLVLVYYSGGLLLEFDSLMRTDVAVAISLGTIAAGWVVYDLLWSSPLGRHTRLTTVICLLLLVGLAYGLSQVFSGRAAYIHVGALMGTIMAANVWMRILPPQRRMVEAVRAGEAPDPGLGRGAKERSKHNTFMALPVIFIMVSNHFPTTSYGHRFNWALLVGYVLVGFAARAVINARERRARV